MQKKKKKGFEVFLPCFFILSSLILSNTSAAYTLLGTDDSTSTSTSSTRSTNTNNTTGTGANSSGSGNGDTGTDAAVPLVQVVVVEDKLPAFAAPIDGVEEDVEAAFAALADADGLGEGVVLHHPLTHVLVPAPVARVEFAGGDFLQDVAGELVEDCKQSIVGKGGDASVQGRDVVHNVGGGEVEVGGYADRVCV